MDKTLGISGKYGPANRQFLEKIQTITEKHLSNEAFGVSEVAREMGISRSGLHRKLKMLTKKSVSQYLREQRLNKALELLKQETLTISEIAYMVGFGSVTYFNKCFQGYNGMSPGEARHREIPVPEEFSVIEATPVERSPNRWPPKKVVYSSAGVILLVLLGWSLPRLFEGKHALERSIAVLPFADESPGKEHTYILVGLRSEIMNYLGRIGEVKLVSSTASENYEWAGKTSKEIGNDLKTNYILTGHAQTINGSCRVWLQITETATDRAVWSEPYEKEVTIQNIFAFQQEVALAVARELGASIQPAEKKKIKEEEKPRNLTSYNYYLKAYAFQESTNEKDIERLQAARKLLQLSLKYDSTWALSYVGLGWNYYKVSKSKVTKDRSLYLDSALMMSKKAIHFNRDNVQAYYLQSHVYTAKGMFTEANEASKTNIRLDPTHELPYYSLGYNCFQMHQNAEAVRNCLIAFRLNKEPLHNKDVLTTLWASLVNTGFSELAEKYRKMLLIQENDSLAYYRSRLMELNYFGKRMEAFQLFRQKVEDTTSVYRFGNYAMYSMQVRNFVEMDRYFTKFREEMAVKKTKMPVNQVVGYMFLHAGDTAEAGVLFEKCVIETQELIISGTVSYVNGNGDCILAGTYSAWDKPEKALEHLRKILKYEGMPIWMVTFLKSPIYDNIREMEEFKAIQREIEVRYQREREKTRKVLKEFDLI